MIRIAGVVARVATLVGLLSLLAPATWAQVPGQGFFGSIDGRWMWLGGDGASQGGNGPGGQMMLGYKLSPNWDAALAGDVQGMMTQLTKLQNGTLSVDTRHQHFDLEAGFSDHWWRVNAGLRGIHYNEAAIYSITGFSGFNSRDIYGIGPKVGAGARLGISDALAIVAGANAALLYAFYNDTGDGMLMNSGSYSNLIPQLDGELGVNWRSSDMPTFSVTVGGRVAASFNTAITADASHLGTRLEIGPFVRLAYNFAGPIRTMALTADTGSATATVPGSYLVHFDFDDADLSAVARGLVRQAADDARRGRPATLLLTGPAAGTGSEDYNLALSLRRADAVKAELKSLGLPADRISVPGHIGGESPAAPANGVREASNGFVRIAF